MKSFSIPTLFCLLIILTFCPTQSLSQTSQNTYFIEDFEGYPAGVDDSSNTEDCDPLGPWLEFHEWKGNTVQVVKENSKLNQVLKFNQNGQKVFSSFILYPGSTGEEILTVSYLTKTSYSGSSTEGITFELRSNWGQDWEKILYRVFLGPSTITISNGLVNEPLFRWTEERWYRVEIAAHHSNHKVTVTISNTHSSAITTNRLYDTLANWASDELKNKNLYLNPNVKQDGIFKIVDNGGPVGEKWIEVETIIPLSEIATAGDEYAIIAQDKHLRTTSSFFDFDWTYHNGNALWFETHADKTGVSYLDDIKVNTDSYWDHGLYPQPANVIPNPGFELSDDGQFPVGWKKTTTHGSFQLDDTIFHSGRRSLCFENANPNLEVICEPLTKIAIDHMLPYQLSGYIKTLCGSGEAYFRVKWYQWKMETGYTQGRWYELGFTESEEISGIQDWTRVSLSLNPPDKTTHALVQCVAKVSKFHKIWFDDLYLDGLGSENIEILYSQGGYHTKGTKQAVVRTKNADTTNASTQFRLIYDPTGVTVYQGPLTSPRSWIWGGYYRLADFSPFQPPQSQIGNTTPNYLEPYMPLHTYHLEVVSNSGQIIAQSHPFVIEQDLYQHLAENTLWYFKAERCGCEVPGVHEACHTDDAKIVDHDDCQGSGSTGTNKDVTGAWHDAGNYSKYVDLLGIAPVALVELGELTQNSNGSSTSIQSKAFDEACWGADWLCKMQKPNGNFWRQVCPGETFMAPEDQTDGIPGTVDDRLIVDIEPKLHELWLDVFALARLAYTFQDNLELSNKYLTAALKAYDYATIASSPNNPLLREWEKLEVYGRVLAADTYLYFCTGDYKFSLDAEEKTGFILDKLENGWVYHPTTRLHYIYQYRNWRPFGFFIALMEWYDYSARQGEIDEQVKNIMRGIARLCDEDKYSPFGHLTEFVDGDPRYNTPARMTKYVTSYRIGTAILAARAALFIDDQEKKREYITLAEHHLQWILGRNLRGVSMFGSRCGTFYKIAATMNFYAAIDHFSDGIVSGGVCHGLIPGQGYIAEPRSYGPPGDEQEYWVAHPKDFPVTYVTSSDPVPSSLGCSEVWAKHGAHFIQACVWLEYALNQMTDEMNR